MTTGYIEQLLIDFNLTKEELDSRKALNEFAHSLSSIIIDEFIQKYILDNKSLSVYIVHVDTDRLIKNIKEFVVFVLTARVDEEYIRRIHQIGTIHFTIKLDPSKVSYGFLSINEVINQLAGVNEIVKEYRPLISKVLRFVEHVMNDGYYIEREKEIQVSIDKLEGQSIENDLYIGLQKHKLNLKKLQKASSAKNPIEFIENIESQASKCEFGVLLMKLQITKDYEYILGFDIDNIIVLHNEWHSIFLNFKLALEQKNKSAIDKNLILLEELTHKISTILDKVLENSFNNGKIALDSGVKSMKYMTSILGSKTNYDDILIVAKDTATDILKEFTWAVEDLVVSSENLDNEKFHILKTIRHHAVTIYIGVQLKHQYSNSYMQEMIYMLLEIYELHFTIKDREESLVSFADKAQSANKAKDMFLANMSHELRTPINAITGFSQILMRKKDISDSTKQYVEKIYSAGSNLLELVNTILDFAKLEAGKMQFNPKLSNVSSILSDVNTLIEPLALKKNINYHMANIVSLNLYIDEKLIRQVLVNLLTNAIKFTPDNGKVELIIEFDYDKHVYIFKVKDSGIGISKEGISKLFQPFSQVDDSYKKQEQGSGLGLMISKKIIEDLHKGKIWVESQENEGSVFYVSLPTPMVESHTFDISNAPKGSKHILIAEDSTYYQNILIENLKDMYSLTITDGVNKAKELITQNKYDFLILDFFLIDGVSSEILQFMEEENISIQSMVISAEDEINIYSSLAGSSNLEGIMNKSRIDEICASLKGEVYDQ